MTGRLCCTCFNKVLTRWFGQLSLSVLAVFGTELVLPAHDIVLISSFKRNSLDTYMHGCLNLPHGCRMGESHSNARASCVCNNNDVTFKTYLYDHQ